MRYIEIAEKLLTELYDHEDEAADSYPEDCVAEKVREAYETMLEMKQRMADFKKN